VNKIYPDIKIVSEGPHIYQKSFLKPPYSPSPEGDYGFFYRFVVSRHEIWDRLYLEKVKFYDEEEIERRIDTGKKINVEILFPSGNFDEQIYVESIHWADSVNVELTINGKIHKVDVSKIIPFILY